MIRSSLDNINVAIAKQIDSKYDNVVTVADNIDDVTVLATAIDNGDLAAAANIANMEVATGPEGSVADWDGTTLTIPVGATGVQGKSHYDIAVDEGYEGTATEWLAEQELISQTNNTAGNTVGNTVGNTLNNTYGNNPSHIWDGTKLSFTQEDGVTYGDSVDLKGDTGAAGRNGQSPVYEFSIVNGDLVQTLVGYEDIE